MGLIGVYDAYDALTAQSVCDLLRQNGVAAVIDEDSLSAIFGSMGLNGKPRYHILIHEEDEERALEMIAGFFGTLGELAELEVEEPEEG
jgi:hypothetical protein